MSEPGWTHLESPDFEPDAEIEGYAVDAAAVDAAPPVSDSESIDEIDDGDGEAEIIARDNGPTAALRARAILAGVGKGASITLQTVGRMNPRMRIGVASGLSVLALAGALVSRGTGRPAPKVQVGDTQATAKQDGEVKKAGKDDLAKTDKPAKDADTSPKQADPNPDKDQKEHKDQKEQLADAVSPPVKPAPETKKDETAATPPVDSLAEKLPAAGTIPDSGAVLVASGEKVGTEKDAVDLPSPNVGKPKPDPLPDVAPPLPPAPASPAVTPAEPSALKLPAEEKAPLPDPKPVASPLVDAGPTPKADSPAGDPVSPLPPTGDGLDKLPPPIASTADQVPPPLPETSAPDPALPPAKDLATAPETAPATSPGLPAVEKLAGSELPPPGKAPEPSVPDSAKPEPKIDAHGLTPVSPSLSSLPEPAAPPAATAPEAAPKPSTDLIPSPPKEFPKIAVEAAAGAVAAGAATATAAAAAIPRHDKIPSESKSESDEPIGVPIRNSKASRPHDLNASDDPRGDDSLALFGSGPDTSAVSPSPAGDESGGQGRRFEVEAPIPKTRGRIVQADPDPKSSRVEVVYHPVAAGENFWTISRLYYGSGRYFVALWGANKKTVPVIDELYENQVIVIPAQEDLDPALIKSAQSYMASASKPPKVAVAKSDRRGSLPAAAAPAQRPRKVSGVGIDVIADEDDDDFAARGRSTGQYRSRERDIDDGLDRVSDTRANSDADLPIHKVRPRETLRSIARDRLGDSRRAGEILRLNRGLIDDPSSLVAGQVIELPEDAKPGRR